MDTSCKGCGSTDFADEDSERVCTNCGDVQEQFDNGQFSAVPNQETLEDSKRNKNYEAKSRLTDRIRGETNDVDERRQIFMEKSLNEIRKAVKQLMKHPSAVEETIELIKATFRAYQGRLLKSKKFGLVGACIYYLSAKHQLAISLSDICKVLNIKLKIINVCLKQVRQLCPEFEYERPNIRDLVRRYIDDLSNKSYDLTCLDTAMTSSEPIDQAQLHNESQPLIDEKDRVVLENRVMLLIDLFEAMHPYSQPAPQSLIIAVIYHAWRSLDTFKMIVLNLSLPANQTPSEDQTDTADEQTTQNKIIRMKHLISFEKFCQIGGFKRGSSGYKVVTKLQSSLIMLGKYLGDVNKVNLPWYLKDIIENSPHLIQEHMRTDSKKNSLSAISAPD